MPGTPSTRDPNTRDSNTWDSDTWNPNTKDPDTWNPNTRGPRHQVLQLLGRQLSWAKTQQRLDGRIAVLAWTLWEPQGAFGEHDFGSFGSCGSCVQDTSCGGIASVWIQVTREKGGTEGTRQSSRGLDLWLGRARSKSKADSECSTGPRQLVQQL